MANDTSVKEPLQIILFYLIWLQNMLLKDVNVWEKYAKLKLSSVPMRWTTKVQVFDKIDKWNEYAYTDSSNAFVKERPLFYKRSQSFRVKWENSVSH